MRKRNSSEAKERQKALTEACYLISYEMMCALQVNWYRRNGRYPNERIKVDGDGVEYVAYDDQTWNKHHPGKPEAIKEILEDLVLAEAVKVSAEMDKRPKCADCGGPRSETSGKYCFNCWRKRVETKKGALPPPRREAGE